MRDAARGNGLVVVAEKPDQAARCELVARKNLANRLALPLAERLLVGGRDSKTGEKNSCEKAEELHAALSRLIGRTLSAATIWAISL